MPDFSISKVNFNLFGSFSAYREDEVERRLLSQDHTEVVPGTFARTGGNINFTDILSEGEYFYKADPKSMGGSDAVKNALDLITKLMGS